jgi:hypothetical protein
MATKKPSVKCTPEICNQVIELGKLGSSQKMIWSQIGISKSTAENWKKTNPEFAEALDLALVHAQAYWETQLLANIENKSYNSRLAEIALRGQFQQDYRETRDTKVDVKADVVIDFQSVVNDVIKELKKVS